MKKYIVTLILATGIMNATNALASDTIKIGNSSASDNNLNDDQFHDEMQQNFSNIFNSFFARAFNDPNSPANTNKSFIPFRQLGTDLSNDMKETKDNIVFSIDMPGAKKDSIVAEITPRTLDINYQQQTNTKKSDDKTAASDTRYVAFQRQYSLPASADVDHAKAEYKDGILYVTIPKLAETATKARKLEIK